MKSGETLIGAAEVQRRVRRNRMIRLVRRTVAGLLLAADLIALAVTGSTSSFNTVCNVAILVMIFIEIISKTDTIRTCAHCQATLTEKEVLSMPEGNCLCPHCGKPFQAKINPEEFNF